jgi:hypothetical protein
MKGPQTDLITSHAIESHQIDQMMINPTRDPRIDCSMIDTICDPQTGLVETGATGSHQIDLTAAGTTGGRSIDMLTDDTTDVLQTGPMMNKVEGAHQIAKQLNIDVIDTSQGIGVHTTGTIGDLFSEVKTIDTEGNRQHEA